MKSVVKILLCLLFSALLGIIAYLTNTIQFNSFVSNTFLQIIGTIFAINIGIVPFLHYELNKLEKEFGIQNFFIEVKKEIKQNVTTMTIIVIVSSLFGIVMQLLPDNAVQFKYLFSSLIISSFFVVVIMLFDTVSGVLELDMINDQK